MVAKYDEGEFSIVEAYRSIRTSITVNQNIKTILVTSSEMNEGKTTTVSNIAQCFADLDKVKILLIDGDLRKPSLHRHFEIDNTYGLIDALAQTRDLHECVKEVNNLHILTTGNKPSNAAEILDSDKMRDFIQEVKKKYDYVFVDSPPVSRVNDACIMAKYIDGTIVVSASNEINRELAKMTRTRLKKVNANIVGVILNKYKSEGYSYYGYYGYGEEEKKSKFRLRKKRR